ncbi:MerR family transcriptional regulator [Azospirillum picis]|uniref:DNA-binding transcriptional MerR regulator n=1 Tax=Azospirillum picis TaxID=488438 RepID=A0ABU0MEM4_9PROT|nr:MerR family transcriptional regulator [Azospirillum picis]MBP2298006.1 DNA-binding transcriptional MerR regulator [Azospirillum picis]MDQ0531844.1 DNA-binding transcriptional MerR regulator [Azospirillum picis]
MKSATAYRTISEVSADLSVPQHVLRFWETKFPQIRPLKRGGGRRYYRPEDVDLLRRIQALLYEDRYTIKGVQRLLKEGRLSDPTPPLAEDREDAEGGDGAAPENGQGGDDGTVNDMRGGMDDDKASALSDAVRHEITMVVDELNALRSVLSRLTEIGSKKS